MPRVSSVSGNSTVIEEHLIAHQQSQHEQQEPNNIAVDPMLHRTHPDWDYDDDSAPRDIANDGDIGVHVKPILQSTLQDEKSGLNDESGSTWSAYFSSSASAEAASSEPEADNDQANPSSDEGNQLLWNINEMFNFNFRVASPVEDEQTLSLLDTDARKLMYNAEDQNEDLHRSRIKSLLSRFLSLDSPRLSGQMMEFLLLEENLDLFMSLITRIDPAEGHKFDWNTFCTDVPVTLIKSLLGPRDMENEELQRLSFNALNVLCGTAASNIRLLDVKIRDIVIRLFDSFHPASNANFYHCLKLLSNLLQRDPTTVLDTLMMPTISSALPDLDENSDGEIDEGKLLNSITYIKPLIFRCIPYVSLPPVANLMYNTLCKKIIPEETDDDETKKLIFDAQRRRFEELAKFQFIETFLRLILVDKDQQQLHEHMVAAAEFLIRFTEEACDIDFGSLLFSSLELDSRIYKTMLEVLADNSSTKYPEFQRRITLDVFYTLSVKTLSKPLRLASITQLRLYPSAAPDLSSKLESISNSSIKHCTVHIDQICALIKKGIFAANPSETVESIKFSSFEVVNPIKTDRIHMLEVLAEIMKMSHETPGFMERIPVFMWKLLTDWFFDLPHNNTFHNLFFKIFAMTLKSEHKSTIKQLLTRQRLLQRSIESFALKESNGLRGHILLILNYIRLLADTQDPSDYIPQVLSSSAEWKTFLPTLQRETSKQMFRPSLLLPFFDSAATEGEPDFSELGPGSDYALSIGFKGEKQMQSINVEDEVADAISSPPLSPATAKKKKTKRKKKKSDPTKLEDISPDLLEAVTSGLENDLKLQNDE